MFQLKLETLPRSPLSGRFTSSITQQLDVKISILHFREGSFDSIGSTLDDCVKLCGEGGADLEAADGEEEEGGCCSRLWAVTADQESRWWRLTAEDTADSASSDGDTGDTTELEWDDTDMLCS